MRRIAKYLFLSVAAVGISVSAAQAQSWCKRTNLNDAEQAICDTPRLSALDGQMNAQYFALSKSLRRRARRNLRSDQRYWLRNIRNTCGYDIACLIGAYEDRMYELDQY